MNLHGMCVLAEDPRTSNGYTEVRAYYRTLVRPGEKVYTNIRLSGKDSAGLALASLRKGTLINITEGYIFQDGFTGRDGNTVRLLKARVKGFQKVKDPDEVQEPAEPAEAAAAEPAAAEAAAVEF